MRSARLAPAWGEYPDARVVAREPWRPADVVLVEWRARLMRGLV